MKGEGEKGGGGSEGGGRAERRGGELGRERRGGERELGRVHSFVLIIAVL